MNLEVTLSFFHIYRQKHLGKLYRSTKAAYWKKESQITIVFPSLKDCKHRQSLLVIFYSKWRNIPLSFSPLVCLWASLTCKRWTNPSPLVLNGKIASVCLTAWLESWKPYFPFSPLSSHSCTISYEPSHIYCEFSCIHLLELYFFLEYFAVVRMEVTGVHFAQMLLHLLPHEHQQ